MKRFVDVRLWLAGVCVAAMSGAAVQRAEAAPVFGQTFRLPQPDGTRIEVRIWGDEFYGITESMDGYTLIRDPDSLFFCYARLSPDGNDLVSTGVAVGAGEPAALGLAPHIRINPEAAHAKAAAARARWEEEGRALFGGRDLGRGPTTGSVQGICLIVDFSDDVWTIPPTTVLSYCNQAGYTGYGNNGSVRDYFHDVSGGLLTYTNYVPTAYYRAAHPKTYYTDPSISYGRRARELIVEACTYLNNQGFDFSQYDADHNGYVDALNCFYAGDCPNNWAEGLWPHAGSVSFCADGVCTYTYQITDMGSALYLSTFCHENGHMLMGWPDLYDYDYDSTGVGQFCLMCYGTTATNPCKPCAYMRYVAGWSSTTILTSPNVSLSVPSSSNTFYKYNHPSLPNEYYLIENRQRTGRDSGLPDDGLAIWHIDTQGNNSNQQQTPSSHYLVTLVQADGRWDMEHNVNYGDSTDLYAAPTYTQCTPSTNPNTNWWSGSASGLYITNISASGSTMTFSFNCLDCNNNGVPDYLDIANGTSQDCNSNGIPDECEQGDLCPPTDLHWVTTPTSTGTSSITMEAYATDPAGVEYYFNGSGIGAHSRTWSTVPSFTDAGLETNRPYSYSVKARDRSVHHNETAFSDGAAVATFIETPTALSFGTITNISIAVTAPGPFSRLTYNQSGLFFEVTTLSGTPVGGAQVNTWMQVQSVTANGLSLGTTYRFRVKARNYYGQNETPWYPDSGYVQQATTGASCARLGDVNQDGAVNGLDIAGFVRAKLGAAPVGGENQACANYGGSLNQDVADFVADLLGL
jgi:M6 family metalloprotease-like protein